MGTKFANRPRADAAPVVNTNTAFTATSTAAVPMNTGYVGKFVVTMTPTQACYIKFGDAAVGAATTNDWPLAAGVTVRFVCSNDTNNFRVIRNSADGALSWSVSGRVS